MDHRAHLGIHGQREEEASMKRKGPKRCRWCGCTDDKPCIVDGIPCYWVNSTYQLCSNPKCLEKAAQAKKRK
jgi:hypothetical protein